MKEELKCPKCNEIIKKEYEFCPNCGNALEIKKENAITINDYDSMYLLSDDDFIKKIIEKELLNEKYKISKNMIPSMLLKRKLIFRILLLVLIFTYVTLIFFHFPIYTYLIGAFIIAFVFIKTAKFDVIDYLKKEIVSRPSEKISNIIIKEKENLTKDISKKIFIIGLIFSFILPCIIFIKPRIMYEKQNDGYAVRFYTFGITNFKTAQIPSTHNGKKVIALRGNTFSNMPFLKEVKLPNTIIEIRGQTFKNDISLQKVNIPNNLKYLGGGAFYNCKKIDNIVLPDTLTYMGGEVFYKARSLQNIKLSNNLKEVRGDSFEYCTSLREIKIPNSVTRIGGHAFYSDSNLSKVEFSEDSNLKEIGSSAFRLCDKLYKVYLPKGVNINERAFKESPTKVIEYLWDKQSNSVIKNNFKSKYKYYISKELSNVDESIKIYNSSATALIKDANLVLKKYDKFSEWNNHSIGFQYINGFINEMFEVTEEKPYYETNNIAFFVEYYNEKNIDTYTHFASKLVRVSIFYN